MTILIVREKISVQKVKEIAAETFVSMIKAVADIERDVLAIGGELHADAEEELIKNGSRQDYLWGFNIYPDQPVEQRLEFISMINIRPAKNNRGMEVEDQTIKNKIAEIVNKYIE